jgi:hypothetical protein
MGGSAQEAERPFRTRRRSVRAEKLQLAREPISKLDIIANNRPTLPQMEHTVLEIIPIVDGKLKTEQAALTIVSSTGGWPFNFEQ